MSETLNGLPGAAGSTASSSSTGARGLVPSISSLLSPTPRTTSTTSSARRGSAPAPASATASDDSALQNSAATPSQANASPGAGSEAGAPSAPDAVSTDIGCDLIGLRSPGAVAPGETAVQAEAVNAAMGLLGTPYVWGGESKSGFDCSGLVQFVFDTVGISLPRVAQDQYDAGPVVPPERDVVPGDLVFFGDSPSSVEHVGIFVGDGLMIDAPYTGSVVRFDRVDGFLPIVGITSPGGQQFA